MSNQISDMTITTTSGSHAFVAVQAGSANSPAIWQVALADKPSYTLPYLSFLATRKASNASPATKDKGSVLVHIPNVDKDGLVTSTTTFQVTSHIPRDVSSNTASGQLELLQKLLADPLLAKALSTVVTPH